MNNPVYIFFCKNGSDRILVTDIGSYKRVIRAVLDILKVLEVACVCKLVDIDDTYVVAVFFEHVMNVVGAYETCSSGYKICVHVILLVCVSI